MTLRNFAPKIPWQSIDGEMRGRISLAVGRGMAVGGAMDNPLQKAMNPMKLYFVCPPTGKVYTSEDWRILGELQVEEDVQGVRRLMEKVEVDCPYCRGPHAYSTDELVCPLSQAGV
jgi:hypothetical protein